MTQDHNNTIASFCSDGPQQLMESGLGKPSEIKLGTVTTTTTGGGGGGGGEGQQWDYLWAWYDWADDHRLIMQLIFLAGTFLLLWIVMPVCQVCVFGVLCGCAVFCLEYRMLNLTMWASILVLWLHGWRFGGGRGLSLSWD